MQITLKDGTVLNPLAVTGGQKYVQGQMRDTLTFIFPAETDLAALDAAFSTVNCESLTVTDDTGSYIHKAYTVRAELSKGPVEVTPAAGETAAVYEDRVTVAMSQRTYTESQLANLQDTVDTLVLDALGGE